MKIRTLIVDDEKLARERLRRLLQSEPGIAIIGECGNGQDALERIRSDRPDLVFLDVQMPEKNGFEILAELSNEYTPTVIFVTAYDQYALQAFDVNAVDYLLKPFDKERLRRALERCREHLTGINIAGLDEKIVSLLSDLRQEKKYLERLVVRSSGRVFFIKATEIDWIEAAGNYIKLHLGKEGHLIRDTMNSIEAKLDPDKFLRIHRSAVVQIDRIKELQPLFSGDYCVVLQNGRELTLSRNYRDRLLELFINS